MTRDGELAYSSAAAFLAHYRMLSNAAAHRGGTDPLSKRDAEMLTAMERVMDALTPEERAALLADAAAGNEKSQSSEERRRSQRAQLKLRRILRSKGIVRD